MGDTPSLRIYPREKVVVINVRARFRIGKRFRWVIEFLTGREPPYVWMNLLCVFDLELKVGKAR